MADQTQDNQNVRVIEANNNIADNNVVPDNAGITGHNTVSGGNILGPSNYRDGATASSSSVPPRLEEDPAVQFHEVPVPAGADATTRALFTAINQTNYLIFTQGARLRALEDDQRPPRRHRWSHATPPPET